MVTHISFVVKQEIYKCSDGEIGRHEGLKIL